jgi:hypothetical protein
MPGLQLTWTPVINTIFLSTVTFMATADAGKAVDAVREKLWPTLKVRSATIESAAAQAVPRLCEVRLGLQPSATLFPLAHSWSAGELGRVARFVRHQLISGECWIHVQNGTSALPCCCSGRMHVEPLAPRPA